MLLQLAPSTLRSMAKYFEFCCVAVVHCRFTLCSSGWAVKVVVPIGRATNVLIAETPINQASPTCSLGVDQVGVLPSPRRLIWKVSVVTLFPLIITDPDAAPAPVVAVGDAAVFIIWEPPPITLNSFEPDNSVMVSPAVVKVNWVVKPSAPEVPPNPTIWMTGLVMGALKVTVRSAIK